MPPASVKIHQPAATSQAQQPPSQNISCCPVATAAKLSAAEPIHLREWTIAPPLSFDAASLVNTLLFSSKLFPVLSLPHSAPTKHVLKSFNGSGSCFNGNRIFCPPCRVTNAPFPFIAVYVSSRKGLNITPTVGTLSTTNPSEIQNAGKACTKLVVPSIGSTVPIESAL